MGVKVSVIVGIHNPGDGADACIRSVLEQSIDDYEVIFVDDGSTDGIAGRLDAVASARDNVRVLRLPHTGSPMRGRNVGLASATGEYVYLMDQTDRLERDALERMYERAVETEADVLVGHLVRDDGVPLPAFEADRARADVLADRLLGLLTPHKLLRREFLEQHRLGFAVPGGEVAEQAFSVRAYLLAKVIAVLARPVCCRLGPRPEQQEDPNAVAAELRALLDFVDVHTDVRQRDRMYAHWLRTTVLRPFLSARFASSSLDRGTLYSVHRELLAERFPERLDELLPGHLRAVAWLLRGGRLDQLVSFANAARRTVVRVDLREVRWDREVLALRLAGELFCGNQPLRFREDGGRLLWRLPVSLDGAGVPASVGDVTAELRHAGLELYLRHEETGVSYPVPVRHGVEREGQRLRLAGEARVDVATAALGEPLMSGHWEVHVCMSGPVYSARTRVARPEGPLNCLGVLAQTPRQRLLVPCWSDAGELCLAVEPRSFPESIALVSPGASITRQDDHLYVVVPVPYVPPSGGPPLELVLRNTTGRPREVSAPALVEPGVPGRLAGQLVAKVPVKRVLPGRDTLGPGAWLASLRTEDAEVGLRFGLEMRGGTVLVRPAAEIDPERRAPDEPDPALSWLARHVPGARHLARLARAGTNRYLKD
ncbi:glycosyltransferase family 2 protein [Thermoactinospora rubra]|uniref:glycosyltransferase family 2 protein n=1 Tax=Thermoactinospora rubra TaxID=1088767 RepID=UPI000A11E471|nr:glycosyltransferase family 2 protein [Thermoactinospora rubra]